MVHQNRRNLLVGAFSFLGVRSFLSAQDKVYVCPMDPDVRSNQPGKCRRCGMEMRAGIPDPVEFHMDLTLTPTSGTAESSHAAKVLGTRPVEGSSRKRFPDRP